MKKMFHLLIALTLLARTSSAQTDVTIRPVLSQYANSATPDVPPGIQYQVLQTVGGSPSAYDQTKCKYTWTITNGKEAYSNSTTPVKSGDQNLFVTWNNVNGSGNAQVVITSVNSGASNVCPLLGGNNNIQRTINVPIQYFGALDLVRVNGTPVSSGNLNCGTSTVTFSVPAPTTTYPANAAITYNWSVPNGSIISGQGTNTIQVNPNINQTITATVNAKRNDNVYTQQSKVVTLSRPSAVGQPTVSFVDLVCSGQTKTATASATNATAYEWTSNGGVYVNGSQNPGIIGSSAGISGTAAGTYTVRGYSTACQTYGSSVSRSVKYGQPETPSFIVNGQSISNGTFCAGTQQNIDATPSDANSSYNWYLNSGSSSTGTLTSYGGSFATFNSYAAGSCYGIGLIVTNSCGNISTGLSLCATSCFARYSVSPNPAKDYVNVEFDGVEDATSLPDELVLLDEKSGKEVKYVNVQEMYAKKQLGASNKIELTVKDLPRGTYYLQIKNNRKKGEEVDVIRLIIE